MTDQPTQAVNDKEASATCFAPPSVDLPSCISKPANDINPREVSGRMVVGCSSLAAPFEQALEQMESYCWETARQAIRLRRFSRKNLRNFLWHHRVHTIIADLFPAGEYAARVTLGYSLHTRQPDQVSMELAMTVWASRFKQGEGACNFWIFVNTHRWWRCAHSL